MAANPLRQQAFVAAVESGELAKVRLLLKAGVDPNEKDIHTPLMLAGRYGHDEVFFELVKAGADLHAIGKYGSSVLNSLAAKGSLRVIQADDLPMSLLDACRSNALEVVRALIAAGADVNHQDRTSGTPLLAAVCGNRPEIVAELLQRGAATDAVLPGGDGDKRHFKKNALEIAQVEGFAQIVELLRGAGAGPQERPARPAEPGTITQSWKLIQKWLKENAPDWKALNKGATARQLAHAEQDLGLALPEELKESHRLHNGGGPLFPSSDNSSYCLMPLDEVVQVWQSQKQVRDVGDFDDRRAASADGIRHQWWNDQWIPFADNGAGDLFCIDLAPASGGTVGQVISHNHESASTNSWPHPCARGCTSWPTTCATASMLLTKRWNASRNDSGGVPSQALHSTRREGTILGERVRSGANLA
jgi:cell wall assembly regulator SMI1